MVTIKQYLAYSRAAYVPASAVPVLLGAAAAWRFGRVFDPLNFALTLAGMVFVHFAVNLFNDYFDFIQGADQINENRSPFGGGSGFIVSGAADKSLIFKLALFSLTVSFLCGLALLVRVDGGVGPIFWLMLAGFIGGVFYTAPPLKFSYRGLGEADIFITLCVLPVVGAYYAQTGALSWTPVVVSLPISFLMTGLLWINQFPDSPSDSLAGKRTLVVRMGTRRARFVYLILIAGAYATVAIPPLLLDFGAWYLMGLTGLGASILACRIIMTRHDQPRGLFPGQAMSVVAHAATGTLCAVGLLL